MTDDKAFHFSAKLGANEAYEGFYYTVRRDSNDNTETVYMNVSLGFIDDDSLISDGVTTLATWKEAAGAADLYVAQRWDLSGSGNHFTQNTLAKQPLLPLNGSGVPASAPEFDGTDDFIVKTITEYTSPSTLFMVYKSNHLAPGSRGYLFNNSTGGTNAQRSDGYQFYIYFQSTFERVYLSCWDSDGDSVALLSFGDYSDYENIKLITLVTDGVDNIKGYFNGVLKFNKTVTDGFLSKYRTYIMGKSSIGGWFLDGFIHEVVLYNKVFIDTDREIFENELIKRHSIVT